MANPEKGEVALQIGGATYTLVVNTNALCELQALFSTDTRTVTAAEVFARVKAGSLVHARGFLWCALRKYHRDLSIDRVGELLDELGGSELGAALARLAQDGEPDPKDLEALGLTGLAAKANPPQAQTNGADGTGRRSTKRPARSV